MWVFHQVCRIPPGLSAKHPRCWDLVGFRDIFYRSKPTGCWLGQWRGVVEVGCNPFFVLEKNRWWGCFFLYFISLNKSWIETVEKTCFGHWMGGVSRRNAWRWWCRVPQGIPIAWEVGGLETWCWNRWFLIGEHGANLEGKSQSCCQNLRKAQSGLDHLNAG